MDRRALQELRQRVNQELKDTALVGITPDSDTTALSGLSSGSLMLNIAMSGSPFVGYVWGRIAELYGPESSGKTTLALHAIKEAQFIEDTTDTDVPALFIDMEHALNVPYAESLGIDLDRLTISQPGCAEDALNAAEQAIRAGFKLVVIDSVAALAPRAEVEGEMGEAHVGLQARLMGQACRKLAPLTKKKRGALVIFINQIRLKIGTLFGNPETRPGGKALAYYATYLIEIRAPRSGKRTGKAFVGYSGVSEEDQETATEVNAVVKKNKVFPPHRKASFVVEYGKGIDRVKDLISFLVYSGAFVVPNSGKSKTPVILLPERKKKYTAVGLSKIIKDDPSVLAEIYDIITSREIDRDTNC